ncbi:glycosyltransferase [Pontibacter vulgaris]|uniref:glycosyltransferase n=1 Tax=Pontibacter vulgaris TaxID=2905679 RepID=UPI001FA75E48|nr:glycosyltransferase [Pontibacter vulgaris]
MQLMFFTSSYPYGTGETFIENEIAHLSEAFDKILIFPLIAFGQPRTLPDNAEVVQLEVSKSRCLPAIPTISVIQEIVYFVKKKLSNEISFEQIRYLISYTKNLLAREKLVESWLKINKINTSSIFYSYWTDEWATILALLKENGLITNFYSRVHGFDLYEERSDYGFIPFRNLQLKHVSKISAVSIAGYNYLLKNYPLLEKKIFMHRLGVSDNGIGPFNENNSFTLLSCSNVIPLKRVNLIVEILSYVKLPLKWVHFGDGPQLNEIKELAKDLPKNISVDFKGSIANKEIVDYYRQNQVNLFITTTESEGGCPVSIQEAISFGIPTMGTNVGGIPEIVNSLTGILIQKDFDPNLIADLINNFSDSKYNTLEFRKGVRYFWEQRFRADKNFKKYISDILLS